MAIFLAVFNYCLNFISVLYFYTKGGFIMNYDIKLIGLDLDGTVFNDNKHITERTLNAFSSAIDKGVTVLPATGRPYQGLPTEFTSIQGINYAITSNGSSIRDLRNGELIYEDLITLPVALKALDIISDFDSMMEVYIDGCGYASSSFVDRLDDYMPAAFIPYFHQTKKLFDGDARDYIIGRNKPLEKINLLFCDMSEREKALRKLQEFSDISVTSAISNNLELNSATANKGNALLALGEILGIAPEQIMACGDSHNDYAMIKAAGLGVAMGNAVPEIKAISDYITLSNEEDGVAYAIEKFVL